MIGTAVEGAPEAAAMIAAVLAAHRTNAVLGGLKALKSLDHTIDIDEAEATKLKSTEVLHVITTGPTMNQAHAVALHPAPHLPPGPDQKVKRASPGPTARLKTTTRHPAPRNSLWGDLRPGPTPGLCPDHAPAPGPGPGASPEATKPIMFLQKAVLYVRMFLFSFRDYLECYATRFDIFLFIITWKNLLSKGRKQQYLEIIVSIMKTFLFFL